MSGETGLYESRVELCARPEALAAILAPVMRRSQTQYAHRLIWTLFPDHPDAARNSLFLYLVERHRPFTAIIRSRCPLSDGLGGAWQIDTHPFAPRLAAGQRLRFRLRAVATRWQPRPNAKRGKRQDVIMTAWALLPPEDQTPERLEVVAETAALEWLTRQGAKHGFTIGEGSDLPAVQVLDYDRERVPAGAGKPIIFGALTYEGLLTVTDPAAFMGALASGLGAARAFGNGLMQIAPAPP